MTRVCRPKCLIILGVFSVLLTFEHAPSFARAGNIPSSGSHHDDHHQPHRPAGLSKGPKRLPPTPPDPSLKPKLDHGPPDPHRDRKPKGPKAQRPPVATPRKSKLNQGSHDSTTPTPAPRRNRKGMSHRSPPPLPQHPRHLQRQKSPLPQRNSPRRLPPRGWKRVM
uniref:Uncharacterized protein n=1 Tax=Rhipicephalus appendiculatus TaxID=34631 RepID=A0A131YDH3_RHIAP